MSQQSFVVLERLLRNHGFNWLLDLDDHPGQKDQVIFALLEELKQVEAKYLERIKVAVPFSPEALEAEASRNPHKIRAFLQAIRTSNTTEMLVMVWRILQGLNIREVTLKYRELNTFSLTVILAGP